ncbi:hypothetical protein ABZW11_44010 [Nonomuraea sp. NPDC004580]
MFFGVLLGWLRLASGLIWSGVILVGTRAIRRAALVLREIYRVLERAAFT